MNLIATIFRGKLSYARYESIAFKQWIDSLHKKGFPRKEGGSYMDIGELFDYFISCPERESFINHAKKWFK